MAMNVVPGTRPGQARATLTALVDGNVVDAVMALFAVAVSVTGGIAGRLPSDKAIEPML